MKSFKHYLDQSINNGIESAEILFYIDRKKSIVRQLKITVLLTVSFYIIGFVMGLSLNKPIQETQTDFIYGKFHTVQPNQLWYGKERIMIMYKERAFIYKPEYFKIDSTYKAPEKEYNSNPLNL